MQLASIHSHTTMASPRGDEVGARDDGASSAKATNPEDTWRMHEVRDKSFKNLCIYLDGSTLIRFYQAIANHLCHCFSSAFMSSS